VRESENNPQSSYVCVGGREGGRERWREGERVRGKEREGERDK